VSTGTIAATGPKPPRSATGSSADSPTPSSTTTTARPTTPPARSPIAAGPAGSRCEARASSTAGTGSLSEPSICLPVAPAAATVTPEARSAPLVPRASEKQRKERGRAPGLIATRGRRRRRRPERARGPRRGRAGRARLGGTGGAAVSERQASRADRAAGRGRASAGCITPSPRAGAVSLVGGTNASPR
jgi:hypothetical protein